MSDHDPIDPLERKLWERFAGLPGPPGACPSELELAAYLDGRLADAARDEVEAHLVLCAECREAVSEARSDEALPFVSAAVIESAKALVSRSALVQRSVWLA